MRALLICLCLAAAACSPTRPAMPSPAAPVARPAPVVLKPTLPAKRPAWVARKVVADAIDIPASTVTVAPGTSLSAIAARAGVSIGALAAGNKLAPPYLLIAGQRLAIPAGRYHRVKNGETGITIARAYGADWDRVVADNRLAPPYVLRVGERLRLPSKAAVAAMTIEQRAAAFRIDIDDLISGAEPALAATGPAPKPVLEPTSFAGRFAWPLEGRILSAFGAKPGGRFNDGVNIRTTAGTPVKAAADGVVAYAGDAIEGFGGLVLLKHGDGWVTAYAHAEELLVARGDTVKRGEPVARAGATGSVDEPQLHFEIRRGKSPVDPLKQLPPRTNS